MYYSWNLKRFLRYLFFDAMLVLAAILLTQTGKRHFAAMGSQEGVSLPILMYHSIAKLPENAYCITPESLEQDLQWLQENHYQTIAPKDLIAYVEGESELPEKPVMLTFDDGFYNNYSLALPLLEKYDMQAVISVVGIFSDVYAPDAPHNDVYSYLTWEDMQTAQKSGRITFGNHTYDLHANESRHGCAIQTGESEEDYHQMLFTDVTKLQQRFQEKLDSTPYVFAYPYGFLCDESLPVLRECGFMITMNCLEQTNFITKDPDCLYGLGRYNRPGNQDSNTFLAEILP